MNMTKINTMAFYDGCGTSFCPHQHIFKQEKKNELKQKTTKIEPNKAQFIKTLKDLINIYSIDNYTNVPDFILAEYIYDSIINYGVHTQAVLNHYNK